jgi:hypothetical protein
MDQRGGANGKPEADRAAETPPADAAPAEVAQPDDGDAAPNQRPAPAGDAIPDGRKARLGDVEQRLAALNESLEDPAELALRCRALEAERDHLHREIAAERREAQGKVMVTYGQTARMDVLKWVSGP